MTHRDYWAFYWPLAITGTVVILASLCQNGVLARYPDAITELATFALAQSVFSLFHASLIFLPQLATVYARSRASAVETFRFVAVIAGVGTLIVAALGLTALGAKVLDAIFGVDPILLTKVQAYLCWLSPVLLLEAIRMLGVGVLVQQRRTAVVTLLNGLSLALMVAVLALGFWLGLPALWTLVGSQFASSLFFALAAAFLVWRSPLLSTEGGPAPGWRRLGKFYFPVATTGVMFALSRPVMYAFIARMPDGLVSIAALRVAFDLGFIFQQAINQFRHLFVTFGLDDILGIREFMARVTLGITVVMALFSFSPLGDLAFIWGLGVRGVVLDYALDVLAIMTLMPAMMFVRNIHHGILMVRERTSGMAIAGVLRVAFIASLSALLAAANLLDHQVAGWILLTGFGIETLSVRAHSLKIRGRDSTSQ